MKSEKGFTLVELMLVVIIIGVLTTITTPRLYVSLQKSYQATSKNNLGIIRTCLNLYYSANEGYYPLNSFPDGYADTLGGSLSLALTPAYIEKLPRPRLMARVPGYNGFSDGEYDNMVINFMSQNPPLEVVIQRSAPNPLLFDRPFLYNPDYGNLFLCNDNLDIWGGYFYQW